MSLSLPSAPAQNGLEYPGVIDLLAHEAGSDLVSMVMIERRPWEGSVEQRFQLQEKLNAYLSFALDGEMAEVYPQLVGKPLQIRLDCVEMPDTETFHFLDYVRQQIAFQGIALQVRVAGASKGCGSGSCGCSEGGGCGCGPEAGCSQPEAAPRSGGGCGSGGCGCH